MIQDDRATKQQTDLDFSDSGLGNDLREFLAKPRDNNSQPAAAKPARQRSLLPTFRVVPGDRVSAGPASDPGFPGTRAFSSAASRRSDSRAAGRDSQPASQRPDNPPEAPPSPDGSPRRRSSLQQAGGGSPANGPGVAAAAGGTAGRVRGRVRGGAGSGKKKGKSIKAGGVEGLVTPIARGIPIGTRVTVTDPSHPWHTYAGAIVSAPEKYGLGWVGQRLELDGTNGEAFIRPEQTNWKPIKAGPVVKPVALPKAIAKLLPKEDASPASPSRIVPTEDQRQDAKRLFREIGERFNENRKKSKTAAYSGYRHDLMANLDTLVMGGALDLKDATTIITNLEQYTKETEAESTETPATVLGRWLRMSAEEIAGLEVPAVEEELDANNQLEVEDENEGIEDTNESEDESAG